MAANAGSCTERPSAARRSKQVLEAAEACFRRQGFHATSMAQIAAAAKMSVGHIYRYFPGKDDIIAAILERDVGAAMAGFDAIEAEADTYAALLLHWRAKVARMAERGAGVLWLEIMAESARNPTAAAVIAEARRSVARRLQAVVQAALPGRFTPSEAADRVELMMLLTDAVAFKASTSPDCCPQRTADQFLDYARCLFGVPQVRPAPAG